MLQLDRKLLTHKAEMGRGENADVKGVRCTELWQGKQGPLPQASARPMLINSSWRLTPASQEEQILLPLAELLEGRSNDASAFHHAVSSNPDVGQITTNNAVVHDYGLGGMERETPKQVQVTQGQAEICQAPSRQGNAQLCPR